MIKVFPKSLQQVLGEEASEDLAELLNSSQIEMAASVLETADTKFEKRLVEETSKLRQDLSKLKADIIKWMFIFWIGQGRIRGGNYDGIYEEITQ